MTEDNDFNPNGCRRRGRGRPRIPRSIGIEPGQFRCYGPLCRRSGGEDSVVILDPEELEIIRLVDLKGLDQESAAAEIGVSRKTLWRDLHTAREKIADALVNGKSIHIRGCGWDESGRCTKTEDSREQT